MEPIQGVDRDDRDDRTSVAARFSAMMDAAWQQLRGTGPQNPVAVTPDAGNDGLAARAVERASRRPEVRLHEEDVGDFPLPDAPVATQSTELRVRATEAGGASKDPSDYARPERE